MRSISWQNNEMSVIGHISLFSYPVEDETDVDDQEPATYNFNKEHCDYLHEVLVIFWDEFISNDCILMGAVLQEFKTRWDRPCYYVFSCALVFLLRYVL